MARTMSLKTYFLGIVLWTGFSKCEGKICYLSSCSYDGGTKWSLPRQNVPYCKQIVLGGHNSFCPDKVTVLLFDKPFVLSDESYFKTVFEDGASTAEVAEPDVSTNSYQLTSISPDIATTESFSSSTAMTQETSKAFTPKSNAFTSTSATSAYREQNNAQQCYCNEGFVGYCENCTLLTDCNEIFRAGLTESGIYTIKPSTWNGLPFNVYCNMDEGGGWTVFQRRLNGSIDFYRDWEAYKQGFGFLNHEFWLGNDKIFSLTNQTDNKLRIDLVNSLGSPYYASYDLFRIANEDDTYRLTDLGTFNGTAGFDTMTYHRGNKFSTFDRDNDALNFNCAERHHGAWWYRQCRQSNLNGGYFEDGDKSITWLGLPGDAFNIQFTQMQMRSTEN